MVLWLAKCLEAIWLFDKNDGLTDIEKVRKHLIKLFDGSVREKDADLALKMYDFAKKEFSTDKWADMEKVFTGMIELRKIMEDDVNKGIDLLGGYLWELGELFGTNLPASDFTEFVKASLNDASK
ncbi:hypothetical protein [Bacillus bombysepticus]|uniref:hypothetical protein n=1 Tax=Bacillus bombysepticus TaxID=658666 RepID=UPI00301A2AD3